MQLQSYYDEKIFSPANRSILTAAIKNCYKRIVSLVYCTNKAILTTYCIVALTYILYTVPKVIDFPRYNMKCNEENVILRGIFQVVSGFPLHFMLYRGTLDCFSNTVPGVFRLKPELNFRVKI